MKCPTCKTLKLDNDGWCNFCYKRYSSSHSSKPVPKSVPVCSVCRKSPCAVNPNGGSFDKCKRSCVSTEPSKFASLVNYVVPGLMSTSSVPLCQVCGINPCKSDGKGGYYGRCRFDCPGSSSKAPMCRVCMKRPCGKAQNGSYYDKCAKECPDENFSAPKQTQPSSTKCICRKCLKNDAQTDQKFDVSRDFCSQCERELTFKIDTQVVFPRDTIVYFGREQSVWEMLQFSFLGLNRTHVTDSGALEKFIDESGDRILVVVIDSEIKIKKNKFEMIIAHKYISEDIYKLFASETKIVHFYVRDQPFYEFTNFYETTFNVDGSLWKSSEHYFQAQKFNGKLFDQVQALKTPRETFDFAHQHANDVRSDWHKGENGPYKIRAMQNALLLKYTQNSYLKWILKCTGSATLVEHTDKDGYWGDNFDGTGENMLGKCLMSLRSQL
jgi:ribA/ribD-fused uncharacterized protein